MKPACVIASLGTSPAVISELLWYLAHEEKVPIQSVEIWTTGQLHSPEGGGRGALETCIQRGVFRDLYYALPEHNRPAWLLESPRPISAFRVLTSPEKCAKSPFRVVLFERDDDVSPDEDILDIRDRADAIEVDRCLTRRVQYLAREAQDRGQYQLLGSLAGGRKTMSAALQSAFNLHARAEDRLVHVLMHAQLEAYLAAHRNDDAIGTFYFPTEAWFNALGQTIPLGEMVDVHDVEFVPLQDAMAHFSSLTEMRTALVDPTQSWLLAMRARNDSPRLTGKFSYSDDRRYQLDIFENDTRQDTIKFSTKNKWLVYLYLLANKVDGLTDIALHKQLYAFGYVPEADPEDFNTLSQTFRRIPRYAKQHLKWAHLSLLAITSTENKSAGEGHTLRRLQRPESLTFTDSIIEQLKNRYA